MISAALAAAAALATPSFAATGGEGLLGLSDDKVMAELADRGLDTLLDRVFELNKVPEAQQKGIRTLRALHELSDPALKLTNADRQKRIKQAVEGLPAALPNINDPDVLLKFANVLLEQGVLHDANTLEYWGENPVTQARLKPVMLTVLALLDKASALARAQADAMANKLRGANDPNAAVWEKLDNLANGGVYRRQMLVYYLGLATDRSTPEGKAERAKLADAAITYLSDFDNADSGVMAAVRVMTGKLNLVKGDNAAAKTAFESVVNNPNGDIKPAPTPDQQYEARYFRLVADLESKDIAAATKGLEDLITWEKTALPQDKAEQDGVAAAAEMMRYRIYSAQAATANQPAERDAANAKAVAVLEELKKNRPDLAPVIFDQLINRLSPTESVAGLDPLLLQGLMTKGSAELSKPESQKIDAAVASRAIDAAKEVIGRQNRTGINDKLVDDARLLIPNILDREGKAIDAAAAYLEYAEKSGKTNLETAKDAVGRAGTLIFAAKKQVPTPPELGGLYDRFLSVAVNPPFGMKELAYAYARRLLLLDKPAEAAKYFRLVDKTDANYLDSQYRLMLCLQEQLDQKMADADRAKAVSEIGTVGETVKTLGTASQKPADRAKAADARLIAAETNIADQKTRDPAKAIQLLTDFEQEAKGLPAEDDLTKKALFIRMRSFMALGKLDQATAALVPLLDKLPGDQGVAFVRQLIDQLDKQFAKDEAEGDRAGMKEVAANEAKLTGFLADWSKNNKDPKVSKFAYQYRVYDATTKRRAGTLEDDPATRTKNLQAAEAVYKDLLSPANHELYLATLDQKKLQNGEIDPKQTDVAVEVGLAFTQFELKDYKDALDHLGAVLGERRLGGPKVEVPENGEIKIKDNDLYWEATAKWYEGAFALAKAGGADAPKILDGSKRGLKQVLLLDVPERWKPQFEAMRQEQVPDFNPQQTAPTTNKVAAGGAAVAGK